MTPNLQPTTPTTDVAPGADGWLRGLDGCQSRGNDPHAPQGASAGSQHTEAWWVRSSVTQRRDALGQPAGFRHSLMFGGKVIQSGSGPDTHRTFALQADFLNERGAKPVSKTSNFKGTATVAGLPDLSPPNSSPEIETKTHTYTQQ